MNSHWITKNYDSLRLPIHIKKDKDYFQVLKDRYDKIKV